MNKSHLTPHLFEKDDECSISRIVAVFPKNWFKTKDQPLKLQSHLYDVN
jgi:hypothetical protein